MCLDMMCLNKMCLDMMCREDNLLLILMQSDPKRELTASALKLPLATGPMDPWVHGGLQTKSIECRSITF